MSIQLESEVSDGYARPWVPTSTFGKNVRAVMKAKGLKQKDLMELLNVKQGTLSDWLRDRRGVPEGPTLLNFAKAMKVPVERLIAGVDDEYDLVCQTQNEGSSLIKGGSGGPTSAAVDHLESIRTRDKTLAGEVRDAISALTRVALALEEEIGPATRPSPGRGGRPRKAG